MNTEELFLLLFLINVLLSSDMVGPFDRQFMKQDFNIHQQGRDADVALEVFRVWEYQG